MLQSLWFISGRILIERCRRGRLPEEAVGSVLFSRLHCFAKDDGEQA